MKTLRELEADRDSWRDQAEQRVIDWDNMRAERDDCVQRYAGIVEMLAAVEVERNELLALLRDAGYALPSGLLRDRIDAVLAKEEK